jgi:putative endonuclease
MQRGGTVYILTNKHRTTRYVGVTSDLPSRLREHLDKKYPTSFTARYNLGRLIFYESFTRIEEAIAREKQLKAGSRKKKDELITEINPNWTDLSEEVLRW